MEEWTLAAMLLLIFAGVPLFAAGMLAWMGIKSACNTVTAHFKK